MLTKAKPARRETIPVFVLRRRQVVLLSGYYIDVILKVKQALMSEILPEQCFVYL